MSRHSKNNTAHSIFTYHERKMMKDAGTLKQRLGGDSMRPFESCWLCLRTAINPVCTPKGIIFCKKCILVNFAEQKMNMKKEMNEYKAYLEKKENEEKQKKLEEEAKNIKLFLQAEDSAKLQKDDSNINSHDGDKKLVIDVDKVEARSKNFWIVDNTPTAEVGKINEPRKHLVCPVTNSPLKLKELIEIKPETSSNDTETALWICSVSKKPISHQKAAVIKSTGNVMLMDCIEKFVLGKKGYFEKEMTKDDIIPLLPGGTGFSYHNKVEAKKFRPVME